MNFQIKEKLILRIAVGKRRSFSVQEVGRKKKLARCFEKWESYYSPKKKTKKQNKAKKRCDIFFSMEYCLLIAKGSLFWIFLGWNIRSLLRQNVDRNMTFTGYWKVLILNFSRMENTVFFWDKKLMERWYLLVSENFLFWTFQAWEIRSFFEGKNWWKDDIYWLWKSSCFELFGDGKYGLFPDKKLMER